MRRGLDTLYAVSLWLAALCLMAIALLVGAQIAGRIVDAVLVRAGMEPIGFVIPSLAEICGYLLAAGSFLALAGTLRAGAHIRVGMVLTHLGPRARQVVEAVVFTGAAGLAAYMTWHLGKFAYVSWSFGEVSSGLVPVPLVYPQAAMAVGMAVATVAFVDELVEVLRRGRPSFRAGEDAYTHEGEV